MPDYLQEETPSVNMVHQGACMTDDLAAALRLVGYLEEDQVQ